MNKVTNSSADTQKPPMAPKRVNTAGTDTHSPTFGPTPFDEDGHEGVFLEGGFLDTRFPNHDLLPAAPSYYEFLNGHPSLGDPNGAPGTASPKLVATPTARDMELLEIDLADPNTPASTLAIFKQRKPGLNLGSGVPFGPAPDNNVSGITEVQNLPPYVAVAPNVREDKH